MKTKYITPEVNTDSRLEDLFRLTFSTMRGTIKGDEQTPTMLTGEPGSGKTEMVKQIATLFGMNLIVIEGSHISEEHLINIPYVIFDGETEEEKNNFYIQNAKSALVNTMESLDPISDEVYQKNLKSNKLLKVLHNQYGKHIDKVRASTGNGGYSTILFIDEFYRTGSIKIKNILRNILNGKIGNDDIPESVYIVYASNLQDTSGELDDVTMNSQFELVNFDTPTKDEFLNYMLNKYTKFDLETQKEDENKVLTFEIDANVFNAFAETIESSDFVGYHNGVRTSPRRMEQIMLYVADRLSKIGATNEKINALAAFMEVQFTTVDQKVSPLYKKYNDMLSKLMGFNSQPFDTTKWKDLLTDQIDAKLSIGSDRKYPTVISGSHGITKTVTINAIAEERNLGIISIDASTLNNDHVIGIPLPQEDGENNINTVFSEPPLYVSIMNQYNAQADKSVEGRQYNHILFIDELSRVESSTIFNKIRGLMLDKKINESCPIPDDIIIVSAMNPVDIGVIDLSDHMKDVVDLVPAEMAFRDMEVYIETHNFLNSYDKQVDFNLQAMSLNILKSFCDRFGSKETPEGLKVNSESLPFYWSVGHSEPVYVSPREMVAMYQKSMQRITDVFMFEDFENAKTEQFDHFISLARKEVQAVYKNTLANIFLKHHMEPSDVDKFKEILDNILEASAAFEIIKTKTSDEVKNMTFSALMKNSEYDPKMVRTQGGLSVIESWFKQVYDVAEITQDLQMVLNQIKKEKTGIEIIQWFDEMIDLLSEINYTEIQNSVADKIATIFKGGITSVIEEDPLVWVEEENYQFSKSIRKKIDMFLKEASGEEVSE